MAMPCIVLERYLLLGLLHAHTTIGLDLSASIGGIVSCLFLVGACSGFYRLDLALISCQLVLTVLLGANVLPGPVGSAHIVVVWLLQMNYTCFLKVQLSRQLGSSILLCFSRTPTPRDHFLHSKIICKFSSSFKTVLMSSRFDICLLLYVMRLAGWLKHCNLCISLIRKRYLVNRNTGQWTKTLFTSH